MRLQPGVQLLDVDRCADGAVLPPRLPHRGVEQVLVLLLCPGAGEEQAASAAGADAARPRLARVDREGDEVTGAEPGVAGERH